MKMNRRTRTLFGIRFKNLCSRWRKILEDGLPLDNVEIIPNNSQNQELIGKLSNSQTK